MAESGFKRGEIRCTCGDTFDNMSDYLEHARTVHGQDV